MTELYELLDYSYMMQQKNKVKERLLQTPLLKEIRIAVLCGSTFGVISEFLEVFLLYYGIKPVFFVGEYNRFYEEAVFPNESLEDFHPDIILIHITNRNLLWNYNFGDMEEEQKRLNQIWDSLSEKYHCTVIQNNVEYFQFRMIGNAARTYEDGNIKYIDDLNQFISARSRVDNNFYVNDINFISSYAGLRNWYDERFWNMYKYPMAMSEMPHYALSIASIIKSILGKNKKTIISDLDNTLWGGEIGEVGVDNIKLGSETPQGESFLMLHKYLKYLSLHGIVLNICSKNEYETGISGIKSVKSVLEEKDFAVKKINWKNKAENIDDILKELNLLETSAVFIDDNPAECDSVKSLIPEVETVRISNVKDFLEEMDILSFFELTQSTMEDGQRSQYYADNIARNTERKGYKDYNEYLKALKMVCHVDIVRDRNIDRVVQLLNKTNQFNFLTNRYTLETMNKLVCSQEVETFVLDLEDKFGSNGIVSVAMLRFANSEAYIEGWVMSCRVFERGLEFVMLELISEACLLKAASTLHGYYRRTNKNVKIAGFFQDLGFEKTGNNQNDDIQEWICRDIERLLKQCKTHNIVIKPKDEK